eukprot:scaffold1518_cov417-Prasinococcus_capsulatus_cf.AAC.36
MRHPGLLVLALGFPGLLPGSSVHDERPTTGLRSLAYHSNGITTGQASQDARTLQAAHSHIPLEPWERRPPQGMPYRLRQDADVSSYRPASTYVDPASSAFPRRAFLYHGLVAKADCEHLIELAEGHMSKSTVVGAEGKSVNSSVRTSSGTFLERGQDEVRRATAPL